MSEDMKDFLTTLEEYADGFDNIIAPHEETVKDFLSYFNELQQENKQLKELCNKYEEEHKTIFETWLKDIEKINKAKKYINKRMVHEGEYWIRKAFHFRNTEYGKDLLQILGDEKNE